MVKVSITLPNNAQITVESEESEIILEVVGMALRDLPRDLMQSADPRNGHAQPDSINGIAQIALETPEPEPPVATPSVAPPQSSRSAPVSADPVPPVATPSVAPPQASPSEPLSADPVPTPSPQPPSSPEPPTILFNQAQNDFFQFCQTSNPLGDMRRVVVAAEGATRFLGDESVDTGRLEQLFDLAGWHRPHSFVQTLRNAARSKFRWLERVPGKSGHYTVTVQGRKTALGS